MLILCKWLTGEEISVWRSWYTWDSKRESGENGTIAIDFVSLKSISAATSVTVFSVAENRYRVSPEADWLLLVKPYRNTNEYKQCRLIQYTCSHKTCRTKTTQRSLLFGGKLVCSKWQVDLTEQQRHTNSL